MTPDLKKQIWVTEADGLTDKQVQAELNSCKHSVQPIRYYTQVLKTLYNHALLDIHEVP